MPKNKRCAAPRKAARRRVAAERSLLGARLRDMRERRGISQTDLSGRLGCGPSNVNHIEAGRQGPTLAQLRKLALLYDCSLDELTDLSGPIPAVVRSPHKG